MGCSPWGHRESDRTERLHFHFPLSCTGEGNGNSLQCSCLENPRDGGAWWAALYGVAQSQTRLSDFTVTFTFMLEKLVLFSPEVANFLLVGLGSVKQVQKFKERGGKRGPCLPLTLQSPKEMN